MTVAKYGRLKNMAILIPKLNVAFLEFMFSLGCSIDSNECRFVKLCGFEMVYCNLEVLPEHLLITICLWQCSGEIFFSRHYVIILI